MSFTIPLPGITDHNEARIKAMTYLRMEHCCERRVDANTNTYYWFFCNPRGRVDFFAMLSFRDGMWCLTGHDAAGNIRNVRKSTTLVNS